MISFALKSCKNSRKIWYVAKYQLILRLVNIQTTPIYIIYMMKQFAVLLFCFCVSMSSVAQDAGNFFVSMPDVMIPYLDHAQRNEMVEMYRYGVDSNTKNKLDEMCSVDTLASDYAVFRLSEVRTMQIARYPMGEGTDSLFCVVNSFLVPQKHSLIAFYDSSWNPLPLEERMPGFRLPD